MGNTARGVYFPDGTVLASVRAIFGVVASSIDVVLGLFAKTDGFPSYVSTGARDAAYAPAGGMPALSQGMACSVAGDIEVYDGTSWVVAAMEPEISPPWNLISLGAGWSGMSGGLTPRYRKTGGIIQLAGCARIATGINGSASNMTTTITAMIPYGAPTDGGSVIFKPPMSKSANTTTPYSDLATLNVLSTGVIRVYSNVTGYDLVHLDGISWACQP